MNIHKNSHSNEDKGEQNKIPADYDKELHHSSHEDPIETSEIYQGQHEATEDVSMQSGELNETSEDLHSVSDKNLNEDSGKEINESSVGAHVDSDEENSDRRHAV